MRVLSGLARGVPLKTVPDFDTRPILDRIKKSLFSILDSAGLLAGASVADLYAGTGTLGIEALSRGAERCLFVERRADAMKLLEANLAKTRLQAGAELRCSEVGSVLAQIQGQGPRFDLVLYDPPFEFSREPAHRPALEAELALAGTLLRPGGRLMLRCERKATVPAPEGLTVVRHWTDGPHAMVFFEVTA